MKPIVDIKDVCLSYDKEPVLEHINLQIYPNDFVGIIGPNGGGKTTLIKGILGLLKPTSGSITTYGRNEKVNLSMGYLPQVRHIDKKFPITVFDVVKSGLITGPKLNRKEEVLKIESVLKEMDVFYLRKKPIGELSGGQMQRVFLCRAIISEPELLILDEPDTFVDNRFEGELYEKLKALNSKMAILLISHDVGTISAYVKTIACVNKHLHHHQSNKISNEQLASYNCPIQIISHGEIPHTILKHH